MVGDSVVTQVKRRKGWRMSCDVGEVTERLENKLCSLYCRQLCSFSNLPVTSPTSQLILQPFRCFTYVTAHSPTLPLLHLRHSSFSNPSFASPTSQALYLIHLASLPWCLNTNSEYKITLCSLTVKLLHECYSALGKVAVLAADWSVNRIGLADRACVL